MPMTKKVWLTIGNALLGLWIACSAVFSFSMIPYWATRDLAPYTKTVAGTLKPLFYAPCLFPVVTILIATMFYYRFERKAQEAAIGLAIFMVLVPCIVPFFYWGAEKDFLDGYVVYQGNCEPLNIGVSTEGNSKSLYVNFTCDNDPNRVFKVWDPDIIAYVANHPGASPLQYRLSVNHILLPTTPARVAK